MREKEREKENEERERERERKEGEKEKEKKKKKKKMRKEGSFIHKLIRFLFFISFRACSCDWREWFCVLSFCRFANSRRLSSCCV